MGVEQEPEIIYCENCDAEILANEAIMRPDNALWCQTCDDNATFEEENEEEGE